MKKIIKKMQQNENPIINSRLQYNRMNLDHETATISDEEYLSIYT